MTTSPQSAGKLGTHWAMMCKGGCAMTFWEADKKESAFKSAMSHEHPIILCAPGSYYDPGGWMVSATLEKASERADEVLVPREPTEAMMKAAYWHAGREAQFSEEEMIELWESEDKQHKPYRDIYQAMLSAAPAASVSADAHTDMTPRPMIIWEGQTPELWLMYIKDGLVMPVADLGPVSVPSGWIPLLRAIKAAMEKK